MGLWLAAAVDLARRRTAPGMFRIGWAVLLLVLPIAGPVIYLAGGRRGLCQIPRKSREPRG